MTWQTPKRASTVILCKITTDWPYKVLLIKRSAHAPFLPGAHVFPGGSLEPVDQAFGQFLAQDEKNMARIASQFPKDHEHIQSHLAAAIRETFEESGLSILQNTHEAQSIFCDPATLRGIIETAPGARAVKANLDNIWPVSWWITPHGETRRFDTLFFLATIGDDQAEIDDHTGEITERLWLHPSEALAAYEEGSMFLPPPTRTILERLTVTASLTDFLTHVDRPLFPIKPQFIEGQQGEKILVMPGDEAHPEQNRSKLPLHTRYFFP